MKKLLLISFAFVFYVQFSFSQIFSQNFSSSSTVSDYVSATPNVNQFNAISSSGVRTVVSINSGKITYSRTDNAGAFSRTTDFSPTPEIIIYKIDLLVSGNTAAQTTAAVFQVGSGYGTTNSAESNANTHSRFGINFTANSGEFNIRDIGSSTNSSTYLGSQTITWVINNSSTTYSYTHQMELG